LLYTFVQCFPLSQNARLYYSIGMLIPVLKHFGTVAELKIESYYGYSGLLSHLRQFVCRSPSRFEHLCAINSMRFHFAQGYRQFMSILNIFGTFSKHKIACYCIIDHCLMSDKISVEMFLSKGFVLHLNWLLPQLLGIIIAYRGY
jgi:hypothetical protein